MKGSKKSQHRRIIALLRVIRNSFPDAPIVFTHGACYSLYLILREVFPSAKPYMTEDKEHVVTMISGRYYHIYGEYLDYAGKPKGKVTAMNDPQKEAWENCVYGQRIEFMLKKYKR